MTGLLASGTSLGGSKNAVPGWRKRSTTAATAARTWALSAGVSSGPQTAQSVSKLNGRRISAPSGRRSVSARKTLLTMVLTITGSALLGQATLSAASSAWRDRASVAPPTAR